MRRRVGLSTLLVAALVAGLLAGCGGGQLFGGEDQMTVTAVFDDVADLADGAPVQLADVGIGNVQSINLDETGRRAEVEMSIDTSAGVPADVTARVRRTSPLGEKFIELRPTDPRESDPPLLEDGATIGDTEVVPDLEQLVGSGSAFFGALGAGELAVLLDESAEGFGGQGQNIRAVLDNLGGVAEGFAAHTSEIETLITSIDQLAADTGPAAAQHADALTNLAAATDLLDDDSEELLDLMDSLAVLATTGSSILREHVDEIEGQIDALRSITRAVATEQQSFGALLEDAQHHNEALRTGVRDFFAQVLNDFIICGVPGGGDQPGDPLNSCDGSERMVTPRILVNLVVFFLVSALLITYGAVTLLGNPFTRGPRVSTVLDEASGVLPGFSAAYDGVIVGVVSDTELVDGGVRITVELDPGIEIPSDVEARVVRASAVGEQRLELNPVGGGDGPPLEDGDEVAAAAESAPPEISEVLDTASSLFQEIPPEDLNTVIHETALALEGREEDLRLLTRDLDIFAREFLEHEDSFRALLETAPPVLDSVTSVGPQLEEALADTATLTQVLADRRYDLVDLMQHGAAFAEVADELVGGQQANLACIIEDAADLSEFAGSPETVANIEAIFGLNSYFFGPIEDIAVRGHAEDVGYGAPDREDQRWLRVLTMVPPGTPPAMAYHPARPHTTLPGGACQNSFGTGVGPGTQADAAPPAIGGFVIEEGTSSDQSSEVSTGSAAAANSSDDPSTYNPVAAMAAAQQ